MLIDIKTALGFISRIIDKIMVVVGAFFIIFAILQFTPAYQWVSFSSFLFGVFLIVVGVALHFESPSFKVPSREGWGTILICLSFLLMATAITLLLYAVIGRMQIVPTSFRRGAESLIRFGLDRPAAWLAPILFWSGVGVLIFGIVLKLSRDWF
jgi:hypothetical protein